MRCSEQTNGLLRLHGLALRILTNHARRRRFSAGTRWYLNPAVLRELCAVWNHGMMHYKKFQRNNNNICEQAEGYAVEVWKWSLFLSLNDVIPPMGATPSARKQGKMAAYSTR